MSKTLTKDNKKPPSSQGERTDRSNLKTPLSVEKLEVKPAETNQRIPIIENKSFGKFEYINGVIYEGQWELINGIKMKQGEGILKHGTLN